MGKMLAVFKRINDIARSVVPGTPPGVARPRSAVPLCKCRCRPEWELRDGRWVLFCENCNEAVN